MTIENEDVSIRLIQEEDVDGYFKLIDSNRDRLLRYFPITSAQISDRENCIYYIDEKLEQARRNELFVHVILKSGEMVGAIIIKTIDWRIPKAELAYFIDRNFEGKGVMSTAMDLLIRHCYVELEMNKLFIMASVNNGLSGRLAVSKGFKLEGILRQEFQIETGEIEDVEYYGQLKEEWNGD